MCRLLQGLVLSVTILTVFFTTAIDERRSRDYNSGASEEDSSLNKYVDAPPASLSYWQPSHQPFNSR
jgi:hypothetical protein